MTSSLASLPPAVQAQIQHLPVLPALIQRLVALDMGADDAYEEVVSIAEEDPVFAARILGLSNSAFLAPRTEITSISQAVARVGAWRIGELASAMAMMDIFSAKSEAAEAIWRHSVEVAVGARTLAKLLGAAPGEAYIAGLVHDLGRLVLLAVGGPAAEVAAHPDELGVGDQLAVKNERARLGFDHAEVGACAAEQIGLPAKFVTLIAGHHAPPSAPGLDGPAPELLASLQLADALAVFSHLSRAAFGADELEPAALSVLGAVPAPSSLTAGALAEAIPGILAESESTVAGLAG